MDADEQDICRFLAAYPGEFVGLREICRRASGKLRYQEDQDWAAPVLLRLVERNLVEDDRAGHFRLVEKNKTSKPKWVAPHLKAILKKSGKDIRFADESDPL